ncbi:HAD family hydrolase [Glaciibacter psychrotolerans]|uniref:Beta-phosphoglucomutase family hydrolase n=1 Tax=Glaciibacter psychrotolerans TaxID=670054 RepID=A0A7Z0J4Q0_9MICO|nr:beta-phosphoglucomutase family hydrolase [Leifsonia psychrotolerans]NYJ18622.1 beta-phosphoglucomutase family hydrolase [Leifsonia psychrotolerans]
MRAKQRRTLSVGLSADVDGCLFDLDGVLTRTATVHAAAWKDTFDRFLQEYSNRTNTPFVPFDAHADYDQYVDGEPREDGIRSFLASRGIVLSERSPRGEGADAGASAETSAETVQGLGARKNERVLQLLTENGVQVYAGSVQYLQAIGRVGIRCAVVSSSTNCHRVLKAAGIEGLFQVRVDGMTALREHLAGKPAPDMYLFAARALGLAPARCVVFEDALSGVEAGRAGGFGQVIGVDRVGQADALRAHGATIVVSDLTELLMRE